MHDTSVSSELHCNRSCTANLLLINYHHLAMAALTQTPIALSFMSQYRLPVELLEKIFQDTPPSFQTDDNGNWNGYPPLLVCKHWKNVVDSATCLWSSITLEVPQWGRTSTPKLLELWMRKSGPTRGLRITLLFRPGGLLLWPNEPEYLSVSASCLAVVLAKPERLESLRLICFTREEVETTFHSLHLAKRLEKLDILLPVTPMILLRLPEWREYGEPYQYKKPLESGRLVRLQNLTIRGRASVYHHPTFAGFCGPAVTTLTLTKLSQLTPSSFAALCQNLPNVESLTFENTTLECQSSITMGLTLDAESWGKHLEAQIVLPKLKTLRQFGYSSFQIPHVILNCGPSLSTLVMEFVLDVPHYNTLSCALQSCRADLQTVVVQCKMLKGHSYAHNSERVKSRLSNAIKRSKSLHSFHIYNAEGSDVVQPDVREAMTALGAIASTRNDSQIGPQSLHLNVTVDYGVNVFAGLSRA
jgi:hypothetical protein